MKTRLAVAAALLFTLFVGWLSGACGRWELDRALRASELRGDLLETHASLLGAQVSFCNADFGEMSQRLEYARESARRASTRLGNTALDDGLRRRDR
jgi:outer membrane murein-binding lipoprotein Lpp